MIVWEGFGRSNRGISSFLVESRREELCRFGMIRVCDQVKKEADEDGQSVGIGKNDSGVVQGAEGAWI